MVNWVHLRISFVWISQGIDSYSKSEVFWNGICRRGLIYKFLFDCSFQKLNLSLLTLSLIAMPAVLIGNHPYLQITPTLSPLVYGLYDTVSRSVWVTAICYIVFACAHGSGGPINNFLSLSAWQPLSRLSYCIYLVHYDLIGLIMGSVKTPPYFSEISAIQNFISIFVLAAFIAIPLVLAFELPIDSIVKLTTGSDKPRIHATSTPDSLKNIGTYSEQ